MVFKQGFRGFYNRYLIAYGMGLVFLVGFPLIKVGFSGYFKFLNRPFFLIFFFIFCNFFQICFYSLKIGVIQRIEILNRSFTFYKFGKVRTILFKNILSFEEKPNYSTLILKMRDGEKIKLPIDTRKPFLDKKLIIKKINEQNS